MLQNSKNSSAMPVISRIKQGIIPCFRGAFLPALTGLNFAMASTSFTTGHGSLYKLVESHKRMVQPAEQATSDPEAPLVARARSGDAEAFTTLVNRYERRIFRLAHHITQNPEDAEDVLQETFMRAYEHLGDFQGHSKFYTWLVRIAVNQALMKLRRRRTDRSVSLDETFDTGEETVTREIAVWEGNPEQRYSQEEIRGILAKAVESLPPIFRAVFVLRDVEELSTEETAAALSLSIPAVKTRLLRARLQLREKLTRHFKRKVEDVFANL